MFSFITNRYYLIYPSWAKLWFDWKDAEKLFQDPTGSGLMLPSDFDAPPQLTSPVYQDYELLPANDGGGIIVLPLKDENPPIYKGLACMTHSEIIFCEKDNFIESHCIEGVEHRADFPVYITFLTPCQVSLLKHYDRHYYQKRYICSGTFEHLESAKDNAFVAIVENLPSRRDLAANYQSLFTQIAGSFGLKVRYIGDTPPVINGEKPHWFRFTKYRYYWFLLEKHPVDVQRCFAMLFYCGLSLRKAIGKRMVSIVLAAQIETFPKSNLAFMKQAELPQCVCPLAPRKSVEKEVNDGKSDH